MDAQQCKLRGYMDVSVGICSRHLSKIHPDLLHGDVLTLRREPLNPKNPNSIMILNPKSKFNSEVGYLVGCSSAFLAPILDSGSAFARAVVNLNPESVQSLLPVQILLFSNVKLPSEVMLSDTSSIDFALYPMMGNCHNLREFDEYIASAQQGANVVPKEELDVKQTVQVKAEGGGGKEGTTTMIRTLENIINHLSSDPSIGQIVQVTENGGEEETTKVIRTLKDVINQLSMPTDPTIGQVSLVDIIVKKGYSFGRAHFWPDDVKGLGE